jgi:hypothetical protein
MKMSTTIAADGAYLIGKLPHRQVANQFYGTFAAYGSSFGGGTVVFSWSPDGGTTKIPLKDENGAAMSTAANALFHRALGNGSTNSDFISIYATMTGSTTPSVTVAVYDNREWGVLWCLLIQATQRFMVDSIREIRGIIGEAETTRMHNSNLNADFREHVTGTLASINQKILAFCDYQDKCEVDRTSIDGRVTKLELHKSRQAGQMSIIVAVGVALGAIIEGMLQHLISIKDLFK